MAIVTVKYEPHPLAELFPEATADEKQNLQAHIRKVGLEERIVLYEGKVLDGRSRQEACAKENVKPRYVEFMDLPPAIREAGPLEFVTGRNLHRRHLNPSQRALIASEMIPAMEKALRDARNGETRSAGPAGPENGEVVAPRKRGRPPKNASAIQAAADALSVGVRSVKRARRLAKEQPEKVADIKAGKATLGKAERASSSRQKLAEERDRAIARVRQCCGDEFAASIERGSMLKNRNQLLDFAAQNKPEMVAQQGLLEVGWPLSKAKLFKAKQLTRRHTLGDLFDKAASSGMTLDIAIDGWRLTVKRDKGAK